jgi:heat shock protein HtpX
MPKPSAGVGRNYLKTAMLMAFLIAVLAIGGQAWGGYQGMLLFGGIGLVINFFSYWFSDRIALMAHRAQPVTREQLPQLYEIVERLTQKAGLPMPKLYVIPSETPNAFATGRNPAHSAVAVTEGIMRILSRPELEAVIGHELGHVKHRDILIGSLAAVLAQAIMFLSRMAMWVSPRDEEGRSNPIAGIAIMILGPLAAFLLQMALSRSREYLADDYSAHLTGRPDMLASALERLHSYNEQVPMQAAQPATAHMMIVNPLSGGGLMTLFSTHPPMAARVERLRRMPIEAR